MGGGVDMNKIIINYDVNVVMYVGWIILNRVIENVGKGK